MSFLESLGLGAQTTVIGMVVVFVVLLIIIYIVKLMSKVSDKIIDPIAAKNERSIRIYSRLANFRI